MTIFCSICGKKTSKLKKIAINQKLYTKEGNLKDGDYILVCEDCLSICKVCPICKKLIPTYFIQTSVSLSNPDNIFCHCPRTNKDRYDNIVDECKRWSDLCHQNEQFYQPRFDNFHDLYQPKQEHHFH